MKPTGKCVKEGLEIYCADRAEALLELDLSKIVKTFLSLFFFFFFVETQNCNIINPHLLDTHPHCYNMCTHENYMQNLNLNRQSQTLQLTRAGGGLQHN